MVFFIAGIATLLMTMYHLFFTLQGIRGNKQGITSLLAPFSLAMSSNFDEKGNVHRKKFLKYLVLSIVLNALVFGIKSYIDSTERQDKSLTSSSNRPTTVDLNYTFSFHC